jgi:hypothetical protein
MCQINNCVFNNLIFNFLIYLLRGHIFFSNCVLWNNGIGLGNIYTTCLLQ